MSEDQLVAAQMELQARLSALHAAQAHLAELDARVRRLDIDHEVFGSTDPAGRAAAAAQRDQARTEVERLRSAAREAHTRWGRLAGATAEPDDVPIGFDDAGYHQPPFAEPQ